MPPRRRRAPRLTLAASMALLACRAGSGTGAGAEPPPWPEGLPAEQVGSVDCPAGDCLVVEPDSTYCSIDPHALVEGAVFASKSRLTVAAGVYPLSGRSSLPGPAITLDTPAGSVRLTPAGGGAAFRIKPDQLDEDGSLVQPERLEIDARYLGDALELDRFFLRTPRWPHGQFRLGDPQDLFWFYQASRNLFIRTAGGSALFRGAGPQTILYAPCAMRGQPDESFRFELADGSALELVVRAVSGHRELGYYTGRLVAAHGRIGDRPIDVTDPYRLAFFGSTRSWAETAIDRKSVV